MPGRRLLVIVALLIGLAALTTSYRPRDATRSTPRSRPETPAQIEPRAKGSGSDVGVVEDVPTEPALLEFDAAGTRQHVEVRAGERARIEISSSEPGSAQVGRDGPIEAIDPASPARFDLVYGSPGNIPIQVRDASGGASRTIGRLEVVAAR